SGGGCRITDCRLTLAGQKCKAAADLLAKVTMIRTKSTKSLVRGILVLSLRILLIYFQQSNSKKKRRKNLQTVATKVQTKGENLMNHPCDAVLHREQCLLPGNGL